MKTEHQVYEVEKAKSHGAALASAIFDDLKIPERDRHILDKGYIAALIDGHIEKYPGSWQNWEFEKKAKSMSAFIRRIIKANDATAGVGNILNWHG